MTLGLEEGQELLNVLGGNVAEIEILDTFFAMRRCKSQE
jgi:hypothetical protein